jgi:hypothetical protein
MRKLILIAGFVLASAAAPAADRGLSLAGSETATVAASVKAVEGLKTAEAPQAAEVARPEAPKYVERPAVIEPKAEAAKAPAANVEQPAAGPAKPEARKTASKREKPRRTRYWIEARIIRELNRHGIYW